MSTYWGRTKRSCFKPGQKRAYRLPLCELLASSLIDAIHLRAEEQGLREEAMRSMPETLTPFITDGEIDMPDTARADDADLGIAVKSEKAAARKKRMEEKAARAAEVIQKDNIVRGLRELAAMAADDKYAGTREETPAEQKGRSEG